MLKENLLRSIPKVDDILNSETILSLKKTVARPLILQIVREVLNNVRDSILKTEEGQLEKIDISLDTILAAVMNRAAENSRRHLRRVINGTGIIIHTNLGRSVLSEEAVKAVTEVAKNYSNLEYDLESGDRGSRYSHIEYILTKITGAESAMVVNNNAAAVLLVLSTLCKGMEAVVSRGELVEIGGSFRIPDVMEQSGGKLVEVGTTNKTHIYDYENAVNENTGALMKVHTSNYRILGFTESVERSALVELGHKKGIPVIEDIGSGSFIDLSGYGIEYEPTVQESIAYGMDIVTFSGDKMLGGPQAGIIAGKKEYIDKIKRNPLTRALRVDKMTIAALEVTLREYLDEESAVKNIPTLCMMTTAGDELKRKASQLSRMILESAGDRAQVDVVKEFSQVGGGSMPLENIPTYVVSIKPLYMTVNCLEQHLRDAEVPIIVRLYKNRIFIDVRTVDRNDFKLIRDEMDKIFQEVQI